MRSIVKPTLMLALIECAITLGFASNSGGATQTPGVEQGEGEPVQKEVSVIELPDKRLIRIHQGAYKTGGVDKNLFFHRPLFAFVKRPPGKPDDYPEIVHLASQDAELTFLRFRVQVSSLQFRELCRGAVLSPDAHYEEGKQPDPEKVRCRRWPLKKAAVTIKDVAANTLLAQGVTDPLDNEGDEWSFSIPFSPKPLEDFKKGQNILFEFSYTYTNIVQSSAQSSSKVIMAIREELNTTLNSEQLSGIAPIFQRTRREYISSVQTQVKEKIIATDPALIPMLASPWVEKVFKPLQTLSIENLDQLTSELQKHVLDYLRPIVQKAHEDYEETHKNTETEENKTKIDVILAKDPSLSISKEALQRFEDVDGVTFKKTSDSESYKPHTIKVSYYNEAWQASTTEAFKEIYVITGTAAGFDYGSSPATFTSDNKELNQLTAPLESPKPYTGIWPGMMVCYFGKALPPGFVWTDGSGKWPNEAWVPPHLVGQSLPKTDGELVGGTLKVSDVGKFTEPNPIALPPLKSEKRTAIVSTGLGRNWLLTGVLEQQTSNSHCSMEGANVPYDRWGVAYQGHCAGESEAKSFTTSLLSVQEFPQVSVETPSTPPNWTVQPTTPRHLQCRWIIRMQ